eukprot:TRINITY_DN6693_c0_g1_i8.p2 TRINITY_DN6693_c0_g1~~TRINITY_DN6693_c0_g1_i8.p2  ORF type:complete len:313 (-),score=46.03 TRINITY_DN6693_c0_g1_i8:105-1043(-)
MAEYSEYLLIKPLASIMPSKYIYGILSSYYYLLMKGVQQFRSHFLKTAPNLNIKPDNKSDMVRKELLSLEKEESRGSHPIWSSHSSSIKINLISPTLRSQAPSPVITIASSTKSLPRKFFPSTSKANQLKPEMKIDTLGNFKLRKMSISTKKLARTVTALTKNASTAQCLPKGKLLEKPKKYDAIKKNLERLREIAGSVRDNLRNCLKKDLYNIKEGAMTERINRPTERCNTQSSSPEAGTKRKVRGTFPSCVSDLKNQPANVKNNNEKKQRRHTTQCHSSQMKGRYTLDTFAAIAKLSLEPIDLDAFTIRK